MNYSELIQVLGGNMLNYFDEIFINAEIVVNDKGIKQPAIAQGDEWISLVPTDTKETIYIRRNGDDEVTSEEKFGSCSKSYRMRSSLRVVYFKDHAKSQNQILSNLMQSVLIGGTKLKSIIRDKWKLKKEESSGDYNFGATTAYFALDIFALWILSPNICEEEFCIDIDNPLKKERCPVAVPTL